MSLNKAKIAHFIWATTVVVTCMILAATYGTKSAQAITVAYGADTAESTLFIAGISQELAKKELVILHPTPEQVKYEIVRQASEYGVSVNTALRIARCESGYKYNASNGTSTAKGVYQFLDGTWDWIDAQGHQYDYRENITQFMKWYPRFPQWWECK